MSFGWSAGDIATAVKIAYNIYEALDSVQGAAKEYREAVYFLREMTRTLEPLKTFIACDAYPNYWKDIREQVDFIKEPVDNFLRTVLKYEPSLGTGTRTGHHRHILAKLKWHFFISKEVLDLKRKIQSHMRVLDSLLQRLTLDVVCTTKQSLPDIWLSVFQEKIRPELITIMQNCLASGGHHQSPKLGMPSELYDNILLQINDLKQSLDNSQTAQFRLEACLRSEGAIARPTGLAESPEKLEHASIGRHRAEISRNAHSVAVEAHEEITREPLQEVYYLVLLYLGQFLKNLFLLLSRSVKPPRQLVPALIAKFNITFFDAVGSPPRVLPYEYFRNFNVRTIYSVFKAFVQDEFKGIPLIDRGRYVLMSMANNRILNKTTWRRHIAPGSTVAMSALVQIRQGFNLPSVRDLQIERCPEPTCKGTWTRPKPRTWATCPACGRQVISAEYETEFESSSATDFRTPGSPRILFPERPGRNDANRSRRADYRQSRRVERLPEGEDTEDDSDIDIEDISIFKRVVRRVVRRLEAFDALSPDDTESVFSFEDPWTVYSDAASFPEMNYQQAAVIYIVKTLTGDSELLALYEKAAQIMSKDRFMRNHVRSLRKLHRDLLSEAHGPTQISAARFLGSIRHRISSAIHVIVMPTKYTVREKVNTMLEQGKDSLLLLERLLVETSSTAQLAPTYTDDKISDSKLGTQLHTSDSADTANGEGEDHCSHEDRSGGEYEPIEEDTTLFELESTAKFVTSARSFDLFKEDLRGFLYAASKDG